VPKSYGNHTKSPEIVLISGLKVGAAARIRTGDLILTNRPDGISGRARSATGKPPRALYFRDPGGFFMPVRAPKNRWISAQNSWFVGKLVGKIPKGRNP
jgi:hypothetical protein